MLKVQRDPPCQPSSLPPRVHADREERGGCRRIVCIEKKHRRERKWAQSGKRRDYILGYLREAPGLEGDNCKQNSAMNIIPTPAPPPPPPGVGKAHSVCAAETGGLFKRKRNKFAASWGVSSWSVLPVHAVHGSRFPSQSAPSRVGWMPG